MIGSLIIAGDGYAYVPYAYTVATGSGGNTGCGCGCWSTGESTQSLRLLRIGPNGDASEIELGDFSSGWSSYDCDWQGGGSGYNTTATVPTLITNADQGVLASYSVTTSTSSSAATLTYYLATTSGTGVSIAQVSVPGQQAPVQPVLQRADGSYVGTIGTGPQPGQVTQNNMIAFTSSGNTLWAGPNDYPQIATAGGGVIGASGTTYDQNGNVTGQVAMPTYSWTGNAYTDGPVDQVENTPPDYDESYTATAGGSPTGNQTAIETSTDFFRRIIARNATSEIGETQTWNEKKGPAQCNQFVHDVLADSFVNAPDVFHQRWKVLQVKVPAVAADWADKTKGPNWTDQDGSKPFACWKFVDVGPDGAQPGDVLATGCNDPTSPKCYDPNDGHGHVGIIVDPVVVTSANSHDPGVSVTTKLVSAASEAPWFWPDNQRPSPPFQPGTITQSDYGFRLVVGPPGTYGNQGLKQYSHVRRYVCY
jgi:hypothetical protein